MIARRLNNMVFLGCVFLSLFCGMASINALTDQNWGVAVITFIGSVCWLHISRGFKAPARLANIGNKISKWIKEQKV